MNGKCIYVAGPYRSATEAGVDRNIRRAARLAQRVWQLGCVAVCPHRNSSWLGGVVSDEWILDGYLELLSRCDAVILTAKWKESQGTLAEIDYARKFDLPIFLDLKALAQWLENHKETNRANAPIGFLT